MKWFSVNPLCSIFLILPYLFISSFAYTTLSDSFLQNITSGESDLEPISGRLLSPIIRPRVPGTIGHSIVQHHFVEFFSTQLPKWNIEWFNSTSKTITGLEIPVENLVLKREPPWTKQGQANYLTLAAHYDTRSVPEGFIGAMDSAVPCGILMHVARSIDKYMTQMHDEMVALGEGGTVAMDMGVKIVFLDGKEGFDAEQGPRLFGSKALSETWETQWNPVGSKYPNTLSQISIFVLLDVLGSLNPTIPSYLLPTHWTYKHIANIESRLRANQLLESRPSSAFFPRTNEQTSGDEPIDDYAPFMDRGVPILHILPSPLPVNVDREDDPGEGLDLPTVRDWAKIVTGFALEWLDMMEVWPN